jgi:hypothetical protein
MKLINNKKEITINNNILYYLFVNNINIKFEIYKLTNK